MLNVIKTGIAVVSLSLTLSSVAQSKACLDDSCGIAFTTIPTLSTLFIGTPTTATYVLTNEGSSNTTMSYTLTEIDGLSDPRAVTVDGSSTCPNPGVLNSGSNCNIVLSFQPKVEGSLDWDLTVTPRSTQRPLVLDIQTEVVHPPLGMYVVNSGLSDSSPSSVIYCPMNNDGTFGSSATPPTVCENVTLTFGGSDALDASWGIILWTSPLTIKDKQSKTSSPPQFAFISNSGNDAGTNVTICPVIDNLTFGSEGNPCVNNTGPDRSSAPTFNAPTTMALNSDRTKLYVTNAKGSDPDGSVSYCDISTLDGSLSNCDVIDAGQYPHGFGINTDHNVAYASNSTDPGAITVFDIGLGGALTFNSTFSDSNSTLHAPMSVLVGQSMSGPTLYLTDSATNTLSSCPLNGSGLPTGGCTSVSIPGYFYTPVNMLGTSVGSYIANQAANSGVYSIAYCTISGCTSELDPLLHSPIGMWIVD